MSHKKMTYQDAGVDITKANAFVDAIKPLIKSTTRSEVVGDVGGFGGLFHIDPRRYKSPLLVSSTDGVGTKLRIAHLMNRHDTVGIDLVAMCVNDIIVQGAEPLFFLDYLAFGAVDVDRNVSIVSGIAEGCRQAGCALIGGENAEMPGFYANNDYDLAGFCVGIVDRDGLIDGSRIRAGDAVVGLASSGIHSNGYSLVRKVFFEGKYATVHDTVDGLEHHLGDELLTPTKIYVKPVLSLLQAWEIKGIAHITGGGFWENIPRILPPTSRAVIRRGSWPEPPIFDAVRRAGDVEDDEMFRVFNMGIGLMLVVSPSDADAIIKHLDTMGEQAYLIGTINNREPHSPSVIIE